MNLFVVAGVLFVVGLAMILVGDWLRGRAASGVTVPPKFWDWFLSVVKRVFRILFSGDAGPGEKTAAQGHC